MELDSRELEELKRLVPYKVLAPTPDEIIDYITNLQEENQRLKELADKYEEEHKTTFIEWTNTLDRNRKAIEYIKHLDNVFIDDKKQDEILNILEGSDKEWQ